MRVFLGSSTERVGELNLIAGWVLGSGHAPVPWNEPGLFPPGRYTFEVLNGLKDRTDAAVFIFGPDDEVWYRKDLIKAPRDNVLIEYGLFAGVLEPSRVAIARVGGAKVASDLAGITYLDLSDLARAEQELRHWLSGIGASSPSVGRSRLMAFQNKFSMPETAAYWEGLYRTAGTRFSLLGSTNKSWILRDKSRRAILAESIGRIVLAGGQVAILCNAQSATLGEHSKFVREDIRGAVLKQAKRAQPAALKKLREGLRVAVTDGLRYQAVVSDDRLVIMPLLNSDDFKAESPVFELSKDKQPEHYHVYMSDIYRTIDRNELKDFVERCLS